jgi:hypothetical protein
MTQYEELTSVVDQEARNQVLQERREILRESTGIGFDFELHILGAHAADWLYQDAVVPDVELWGQQAQTAAWQPGYAQAQSGQKDTKLFSGWPVGYEIVEPGIAARNAPSARRASTMTHYLVNYEDGSFSGLLARGGSPLSGCEIVGRDNRRSLYKNPNYRLWESSKYAHFERLHMVRDRIVSLLELYGAI